MRLATILITIVSIFVLSHPLDELLPKRGEPEYELVLERDLEKGRVFVLKSIGMEWQGMVWFHRVGIVIPKDLKFTDRAFVLITGGSRYVEDEGYYSSMIEKTKKYLWIAMSFKSPFVVIADVPNQPIWGLKEDDLIAETFDRFLKNPDPTLPLLVPMTYGVVRALDAVQDFLKGKGYEVKYFMVSGASKRGWTTYLVGIFDPRVFAMAPMVYDNLNIPEQLERQRKYYGKYSEKIRPYTGRDLPERLKDEDAGKLLEIVDPYRLKLRLAKPKILIMGTNDRYWTVDSANVYVDDLPGETWLFYSPNDGHDIKKVKDVVNTVSAFFHLYPEGKFPKPRFEYHDRGVCVSGEVEGEIWYAFSNDMDFRGSIWIKLSMSFENGKTCGSIPSGLKANVAFFSRVCYSMDDFEFYISSKMTVSNLGKDADR